MKTKTFYITELIDQRLHAAAKVHRISPSAYIRRVILTDLARLNLLTIEELIENQMTDTPYGQGRGSGHLKKQERAAKGDKAATNFENQPKPKAKTILD